MFLINTLNSVRTIKLFQPTEFNLVKSNNVGARNTAANIDNNNESNNSISNNL